MHCFVGIILNAKNLSNIF
nr:hypothetical protein [Lactiplantibacillus plantarum]